MTAAAAPVCRHCGGAHLIVDCPAVVAWLGPLKKTALRKTCPNCQSKFKPAAHNQKYCSRRCYDICRNR